MSGDDGSLTEKGGTDCGLQYEYQMLMNVLFKWFRQNRQKRNWPESIWVSKIFGSRQWNNFGCFQSRGKYILKVDVDH